jgi:hypothetical protein
METEAPSLDSGDPVVFCSIDFVMVILSDIQLSTASCDQTQQIFPVLYPDYCI